MRYIEVKVVCDGCGEDTPEEDAKNYQIKALGVSVELDWCHVCSTNNLINARPFTGKETPVSEGIHSCRFCPKTFPTYRGRIQHESKMHKEEKREADLQEV